MLFFFPNSRFVFNHFPKGGERSSGLSLPQTLAAGCSTTLASGLPSPSPPVRLRRMSLIPFAFALSSPSYLPLIGIPEAPFALPWRSDGPGTSYFGQIKLPRTVSDLRALKENLAMYAQDHPAAFILGYCSTYIFMQTFMIPGTIFLSLLAGALFGVFKGLILVVFNATAGASSCYFLSKLIGKPLVNWLWPEKLRFFQAEAGLALGELKSVKDLYDFKTLTILFLIGSIIIFPTLIKRKRTYE